MSNMRAVIRKYINHIIGNEMRRALQNSCAKNSDAIKEITQKLTNNGYPADKIKWAIRKGTKPKTRKNNPAGDIPFLIHQPAI